MRLLAEALVVAAVYAALLFASGLVATVAWDLYALRHGDRTVSGDVLRLQGRWPWLAVLIAGCLAFAAGCLCGHLFFPQVVVAVTAPAAAP